MRPKNPAVFFSYPKSQKHTDQGKGKDKNSKDREKLETLTDVEGVACGQMQIQGQDNQAQVSAIHHDSPNKSWKKNTEAQQ